MEYKVPSFVSESEQRRLTLAGRFATSVSALPDECIAWLLKNENQAEISVLLSLAATLGLDQRIALKESAKTDSPLIVIPGELAQREEKFWQTEYGIKADFAGLQIPRQPLEYKARFCMMYEKVAQSVEFFYQSDMKAYDGKVWKYTDESLDEVGMEHKHAGTFGFWVADEQEAPDGCFGKGTDSPINLHTVAVRELGWTTTTIPMRQLFGRAYWLEHKVHPDQRVITFCADSGLPGGSVPCVGFDPVSGAVSVYRGDALRAADFVRFRRAVVPSNLIPSSLPQ
jgi:hypothetical protein